MKKKLGGQNSGKADDGLLILITLFIIIFVFIIPSKKLGPVQGLFSSIGGNSQWRSSNNKTGPASDSTFASRIQVGSGNAAYESNPWSEYVTIEARGNKQTDITGWKLKNDKDTKTYELSGNTFRYPTDAVTVPQAALFISPTGNNIFGDIVLGDGDQVIVSSGSTGITSPYKIVNFKENKCSGYIEALPEYNFVPPLQNNCPLLRNEIGYSGLDSTCKDYVSGIQGCHTPKFDGLDQNGNTCNGCVDGRVGISNACVAFIKQHATYTMCINNHKDDPDFSLKIWRVFLGRKFEMWDKSGETISLFDNQNKLVDYNSY